jgi:hypothetical protein
MAALLAQAIPPLPDVEIGGKRVFRRVKVESGKLTWVEFRP